MVDPVALLDIGPNGLCCDLRGHHAIAQTIKDARFEFVARDAMPVRAAFRITMVRTGKPPPPAKGIRTSAAAAVDQAGEKTFWAMRAIKGCLSRASCRNAVGILDRDILLPCLRSLPEFFIHDPQVRNLGHNPFGFGIDAGDALAGLRVLQIAQPVPHQFADIEFIVEQAGAALGVAADRGRCP
ncbi:hypothetical protein BF95_07850 [Sphingobium sp. Ant17]|nr:hypothetical protein BF95_07850 [Sphingobium sp. Ant17]